MQITWQPYQYKTDEDQPWVQDGRQLFRRDMWVFCLNEAEFFFYRLIMRTSGFEQPEVDPAFVIGHKSRSRRYVVKRVTNWQLEHQDQLKDWERRGTLYISLLTTSEIYL